MLLFCGNRLAPCSVQHQDLKAGRLRCIYLQSSLLYSGNIFLLIYLKGLMKTWIVENKLSYAAGGNQMSLMERPSGSVQDCWVCNARNCILRINAKLCQLLQQESAAMATDDNSS